LTKHAHKIIIIMAGNLHVACQAERQILSLRYALEFDDVPESADLVLLQFQMLVFSESSSTVRSNLLEFPSVYDYV
jgi:hypothetical protein